MAGPTAMDAEALGRYADAVVRDCLGVGPGHTLLLDGEPTHRDLVVALAERAYAAGAELVDVRVEDPRLQRARLTAGGPHAWGRMPPPWEVRRRRAAIGPTGGIVQVLGEDEPGLLDDVPGERLAADRSARIRAFRFLSRAGTEHRLRFCIVAWPTAGWARRVYPDLSEERAVRRLGDDLLAFCRLGPEDETGAWRRHLDTLRARAETLTGLDLRGLELRAPGTRLDLGLERGGRFLAAGLPNAYGQTVAENMPTEEVWTSPQASRTEGTFRCTRPLLYEGSVFEDLAGEFRGGRLVRVEARDEAARDAFAAILDVDRGARRLGEVALVDGGSRVGRADVVYHNGLLDENAAAHIAFGDGFLDAREPGVGARSVNRSALHLDVMIGSPDLEVTGITADRGRVLLLAGNRWQI